MEQYCMYLRKSRADAEAEARGEGETLARHERLLLEVARRDGYHISKIYREIVSGETIAARPQMQLLLQEVEQGIWDGVLVVEVERLARGDTIDQGIMAQTFKYSDTKIITPNKIYDPNNEMDEEYFEFGLFMSRREYKTINRRLQRGRTASSKEGKYVGNKSPYGYQRVRIENGKGFTLEPIPDQADIVKLIYSLYLHGDVQEDGSICNMGTTMIAKKLNSMHIPTKLGGAWSANNVRCVLVNPVYAGKIRWNFRPVSKKMQNGEVIRSRPMAKEGDYVLVDGLHPAIIDEKVFEDVQKKLHSNAHAPVHKDKKIQNPLSGILFCAKCGKAMVRRPFGDKNKADTLLCKTLGCTNVGSDLELVEKRILHGIAEWLNSYRLKWEINQSEDQNDMQIDAKTAAIKSFEKELQTLKKQQEKAYDLLEQGIYSTDVFFERSRAITERIKSTEEQIEILKKEIDKEKKRQENITNIIPKAEYLLKVYGTLEDAKAKNDLLKSVLDHADYEKEHSTRWHGSPDDFKVTLYPRIPK